MAKLKKQIRNTPPFKIIQSVQRATDILNCFTDTSYHLTLNEISDLVDLNVNTTRGLVNTLVYNGVLSHNKQYNTYSLGLYFLTKTNIIQKQMESYVASAKPLVDDLAEKYHISASMQLANQRKIYSIYCAYPSNTAYTIGLSEYGALPLYATSSGKLLSLYNLYLQDEENLNYIDFHKYTDKTITSKQEFIKQLLIVQENHYAYEMEEFALGVGSLAVPILDRDEKLICTVSATFFASYFPTIKDNLLIDLRKIADVISKKLFTNTELPLF